MRSLVRGIVVLLCAGSAFAQAVAQDAAQDALPAATLSNYIAGPPLDLHLLLTGPPEDGSAEARADLAAVLQAQATRNSAQVTAAQRDDREESMFAYATVLGDKFNAEDLPLTAALSLHLRQESGVVNPALKKSFHRLRPFRANAAVHPVCRQTASESYPSGHSTVGYLEGYTLATMVPEQDAAILARARQYAANRVVCGVHYPTDTEASRTIAVALFGALLTSPKFTAEVAAARAELRSRLALPQ